MKRVESTLSSSPLVPLIGRWSLFCVLLLAFISDPFLMALRRALPLQGAPTKP
jgi:hypothetical protein